VFHALSYSSFFRKKLRWWKPFLFAGPRFAVNCILMCRNWVLVTSPGYHLISLNFPIFRDTPLCLIAWSLPRCQPRPNNLNAIKSELEAEGSVLITSNREIIYLRENPSSVVTLFISISLQWLRRNYSGDSNIFECLTANYGLRTKRNSNKPAISSENEVEKWHLRHSEKTVGTAYLLKKIRHTIIVITIDFHIY